MKIANFSTQQLRKILDSHMAPGAKMETDLRNAYTPLRSEWNIEQVKNDPGENFQTIHRFIQQLKRWIRGIFHHVSNDHLQGYLDEYVYRLNRHLFKDNLFDNLINRMIRHKPVFAKQLLL